MKPRILFAFCMASGLLLSACSPEKTEEQIVKLQTVKEKASYAMGQRMVSNIVRAAPEIDQASLIQGIRDAFANKPPLVDEQAQAEALMEYNEVLQKAMAESRSQEAATNLEAANAFLEKNKLRDEVTVTESGLQYERLREGQGANPEETDTVRVHYRGTLLDGTEFDSSYGSGEPVTFRLNQVIPGWTEGLQLMKPGAKYKFYLPPDLAYGQGGAGNRIGPNAALIFEVELLGIE